MSESFFLLILLGLGVGTLGTLIGAGGGFIMVPVLILLYPDMSPEHITAISMAIVAINATMGSISYMRSKRIDYKAGIIFAIATVPGSILGVWVNQYFTKAVFNIIFGIILIALSLLLFFNGGKKKLNHTNTDRPGDFQQTLTDLYGEVHRYSYNLKLGVFISLIVGFFSPLLGIGGGIIHVPAMIEWLNFPVHIATATSHFILAIMSSVSVIVHIFEGSYNDPFVLRMIGALSIGVTFGAFLGANLSRKVKGNFIVKVLSVSLAIVGIRILFTVF